MKNELYDDYQRNTNEKMENTQEPQAFYSENTTHESYHNSFEETPEPQGCYGENTAYEPYQTNANPYAQASPEPNSKKRKKSGKVHPVAAAMAVGIMLAGAAGFGGSYLFSVLNPPASNNASAVNISKAAVSNVTKTSSSLTEKTTSQIVGEVADSVVEITVEVVQSNPYYGQYTAQGAGSGVIISTDGYILTNNHVIDGASSIKVTLRSGESYDAKLIGSDSDLDIALLKVDANGLTAATVGDSSAIGVGDKSVIIGNPLGTLGGSVTEGIVSAVDRTLDFDGKTMHLIQTDAAVNPGNSGGGMFNGQGELVGIVVAKSTDTSSGSTIDNIGFVIPINDALSILGDLKEFGYVRGRASTGMAFSEGSNQQLFGQLFYGASGGGVYVASVKSGSNAASAGFNVGDRVIAVDGTEINSISDIKKIISAHSVGDTLEFKLERNGSTGNLSLTLEEYAPANTV